MKNNESLKLCMCMKQDRDVLRQWKTIIVTCGSSDHDSPKKTFLYSATSQIEC